MLNYNEMIECGKKYAYEKKQMSIKKYKAFIEYLKEVVNITFEDNKEQIISYLKETRSKSLILDWNIGSVHYDGFAIKCIDDETLNIISLIAHDIYYDQVLQLESDDIDDDKILQFFDKEYEYFEELFVPCYQLTDLHNVNNIEIDEEKSLVWKIADKFNNVCFDHFETHFKLFGMKDVNEFIESKFSLSFTDERRRELDVKVYECYNSYCETLNELTKKN